MTAFADLSINDASSTARTFSVSNIDYKNNIATWIRTGASYDAATPLTFSLKPPSAQSARAKVKVRIAIPIMDPVLTTKKIDEVICEFSASIPKIATLQQRQDARVFLRSFLSDTVIMNSVDSFQGVY